MTIKFRVRGKPEGKARPRVTSHGAYTPAKTKAYEQLVRLEYRRQCGNADFGDKALRVVISAYYPVPKSKTKTIKSKMLAGEIRPTVKPDCDNIAKAILDALNGIAYHDDAQIVSAIVEKWYNDEPHTEISITEAV
jgi:Holliday junction resolvase RusA-like endonuclease